MIQIRSVTAAERKVIPVAELTPWIAPTLVAVAVLVAVLSTTLDWS